MLIGTVYNIGDFMILDGKRYKVLAVHVYQSETKHTERYYLGDDIWITLK